VAFCGAGCGAGCGCAACAQHGSRERHRGERADKKQQREQAGRRRDRVCGGVLLRMRGEGEEEAAESGNADHLAELQRRGEQTARVGRVAQRHMHEGMRDERAVTDAEPGTENDEDRHELRAAATAGTQVEGEGEIGERADEKAAHGERVMNPYGQLAPVETAQPEGRRRGRERQPRSQSAVAEASLQVQGEAEKESTIGDHGQGEGRQARRDSRRA
jgi:hypothetical protein